MKNIKILMMIMGFVAISACASNETTDAAESDASAKAEAMKQEQSAAAEEAKVEAEVAEVEMDVAAEEVAEEVVEQEEEIAVAAAIDESAANASGNLVSTCEYDGQVRVIRVIYDNPDYACEVTYEKSTGVQTLWSAYNEKDYCLDKATGFVEKQEGWGWTCSNLE
jgi:Na+-translocating ferredoxin:NAD+ oxidoreductase RnfG subunit